MGSSGNPSQMSFFGDGLFPPSQSYKVMEISPEIARSQFLVTAGIKFVSEDIYSVTNLETLGVKIEEQQKSFFSSCCGGLFVVAIKLI